MDERQANVRRFNRTSPSTRRAAGATFNVVARSGQAPAALDRYYCIDVRLLAIAQAHSATSAAVRSLEAQWLGPDRRQALESLSGDVLTPKGRAERGPIMRFGHW